jgi:hypothetical protein
MNTHNHGSVTGAVVKAHRKADEKALPSEQRLACQTAGDATSCRYEQGNKIVSGQRIRAKEHQTS